MKAENNPPNQTLKNLKELEVKTATNRGGEVTSLLGFLRGDEVKSLPGFLQQKLEVLVALMKECFRLSLGAVECFFGKGSTPLT